MRHGEYKTPGGKLVVVDFDVRDGQLAEVQVSGDFFLYPEEALEPIRSSLEGLSASAGEDEVRERVRDALPAGATMVGFSPSAIAIAVQRGLSDE